MSAQTGSWRRTGLRAAYIGLLGLIALVILLGHLGFRAFASAPGPTTDQLPLLAVVVGVASFFSPCAFPLLPAYFSFYIRAGRSRPGTKTDAGKSLDARKSIALGLASAAGAVSFLLLLGLAIAIFGAAAAQRLAVTGTDPNQSVRLLRGLVGLALAGFGIAQLAGKSWKPGLADRIAYRTRPRREGPRGPAAGLYLYGFGYVAAGIGCTGPILAGLLIAAAGTGGFGAALSAFGLFALTMGALLIATSLLVGASQERLLSELKASAPRVANISAIILLLVGLFNLYTAINTPLFQRLFP